MENLIEVTLEDIIESIHKEADRKPIREVAVVFSERYGLKLCQVFFKVVKKKRGYHLDSTAGVTYKQAAIDQLAALREHKKTELKPS